MPNVAVKRIFSEGWEKLSAEEQTVLRERLRALCTKDTEKCFSDVSNFQSKLKRVRERVKRGKNC